MGGFRLFCSIPENLTETSSPAGTTQADRNNQRLYLGWNEISSQGHQALRAEQKLSSWLINASLRHASGGLGGGARRMAQHTWLTGWTGSFQPPGLGGVGWGRVWWQKRPPGGRWGWGQDSTACGGTPAGLGAQGQVLSL